MIDKLTRPSIARAAILPVAAVMVVMAGLAVAALASHNRAGRAASLREKAVLTARTSAPNAGEAVWRFDTETGKRILQSLAFDPDFGSGIIVDDKGRSSRARRTGRVGRGRLRRRMSPGCSE